MREYPSRWYSLQPIGHFKEESRTVALPQDATMVKEESQIVALPQDATMEDSRLVGIHVLTPGIGNMYTQCTRSPAHPVI